MRLTASWGNKCGPVGQLKFGWILLAAPLMAWGQTPLPPDSCHVRRVTSLPGSREFASDFLEAMANDPDPKARDANVVWGLTADLSSKVPAQDRAMYISKSADSGKTWTVVARIDSKYFDADIGEGERNGLGVVPGGREFVITTQLGSLSGFASAGHSGSRGETDRGTPRP